MYNSTRPPVGTLLDIKRIGEILPLFLSTSVFRIITISTLIVLLRYKFIPVSFANNYLQVPLHDLPDGTGAAADALLSDPLVLLPCSPEEGKALDVLRLVPRLHHS